MPPTTNGPQVSPHDILDSLRRVIDKLEAEVVQQRQEIDQLKRERDEFRSVIYDHLKKQFGDPTRWNDFDEKDYTLTIDDLLTVMDEY